MLSFQKFQKRLKIAQIAVLFKDDERDSSDVAMDTRDQGLPTPRAARDADIRRHILERAVSAGYEPHLGRATIGFSDEYPGRRVMRRGEREFRELL